MKKYIIILFFVLSHLSAIGQILDPVKWTFTQNKISENLVELEFNAKIDSGWHLYSQYTGQYYGDDGPVPTSFTFFDSDLFVRLDSVFIEC